MSTYLIDYENVKSAGLAGINHIRKEDSVHLFWSSRENKISIEMMELIRSSESEIVMHKAFTGEKDALDHQLCSYFGYLAGSEGELDFIIVSNDRAYDRLIEFWGMLKPEIRIRRVTEIARVSEADETSEVFSEIEDPSLDGTGEGRFNRNARRRGSKYLRGGKNNFSRKSRNLEMSESEQETEAEAAELFITSDVYPAVSETEMNPALPDETDEEETKNEEAVPSAKQQTEKPMRTERTGKRNRNRKQAYAEPAAQVSVVAETPEEYKVETVEKPAVKPASSFVMNVISGIKAGIVVESGFTADGILDGKYDSRKPAAKEMISGTVPAKGNAAAETEAVKEEVSVEAEAVKEASVEAKAVKEEVSAETEAAKEEVSAETEAAKEETSVETEAVKEETSVETEAVKENTAAEAETEKTEETAEAVECFEKIETESVKAEKKAEETAAEEPEIREAVKPESVKGKAEEAKTVEIPEETGTETVKEEAETESEVDKPEKTMDEKEEAEAEQKSANTRKKAVRRGRPPKKVKPANAQEKKTVVTLQDVITNCKEAEQADWAPDLVNRINSAGDKKELYAATVKLLGQEKGRTIYHMIKGLK